MKIKYNHDEDILSLELDPTRSVSRAEHIGQAVVHMSADHHLVAIDILHARSFVSVLIDAVMQRKTAPLRPSALQELQDHTN